eukprot:5112117-Alexandrium_andersonii.AAC.1
MPVSPRPLRARSRLRTSGPGRQAGGMARWGLAACPARPPSQSCPLHGKHPAPPWPPEVSQLYRQWTGAAQ